MKEITNVITLGRDAATLISTKDPDPSPSLPTEPSTGSVNVPLLPGKLTWRLLHPRHLTLQNSQGQQTAKVSVPGLVKRPIKVVAKVTIVLGTGQAEAHIIDLSVKKGRRTEMTNHGDPSIHVHFT